MFVVIFPVPDVLSADPEKKRAGPFKVSSLTGSISSCYTGILHTESVGDLALHFILYLPFCRIAAAYFSIPALLDFAGFEGFGAFSASFFLFSIAPRTEARSLLL